MQTLRLLLILLIGSFAIAGCDRDEGPAEETGEAIDEAGEQVGETAEEAGEKVEEGCEEVREGADAEDTDC